MVQDSELFNLNTLSASEEPRFSWFNQDLFGGNARIVSLPGESKLLDQSRARRPEYNGHLLITPAGSVHLVLDGVARGYTSDGNFRRIHFRCFTISRNGAKCHICPTFTTVASVNWIENGLMDPNASLGRAPSGTVYLFADGVKHGIRSRRAFNDYQFDYDDIRNVTQTEVDNTPNGSVIEETGHIDFSWCPLYPQ